ncbi:hypothetical protein M378DRAFT_892613 [Amanita muscaria Koide BX008]|uniref:Rad1-domain-containing protein n=1 Tax=Amanita muscaria (strain Koide BX008) TaxID=946122 RepID=A0A0C2XGK0_AMAMK|nr:hypothetical protein M378DRAFT_892613 [Amanita muscaria Koide BX008]
MMPQDRDQSTPILKASVHDVRYLTALFRGVNFSNRATVTITRTGFTITVEEAHALLAFIFATLFDEYAYDQPGSGEDLDSQSNDGDNTAFEIPLNTVIECLNIFGSAGMSMSTSGSYRKWKISDGGSENDDERNEEHDPTKQKKNGTLAGRGIESYFGGGSEKRTSMRLSYSGPGYPLTMILAEDASGPTTTCEITTFEPEPILDLNFDNSRLLLKIILKSSWLREALMEIDASCEKITIISSPPGEATTIGIGRRRPLEKPILRIHAEGAFGSTQMDYPNDKDVLETFECEKPLKFSYRFAHINRTQRALQNSIKTSLRIDDEGLLSLQFLMPSPQVRTNQEGQPSAFIEFRCLALDDEGLE